MAPLTGMDWRRRLARPSYTLASVSKHPCPASPARLSLFTSYCTDDIFGASWKMEMDQLTMLCRPLIHLPAFLTPSSSAYSLPGREGSYDEQCFLPTCVLESTSRTSLIHIKNISLIDPRYRCLLPLFCRTRSGSVHGSFHT